MKIAIIGAGIGGLGTALSLQRLGLEVTVYEAAKAIKPIGAGIGLAANAMKALEQLGIAQNVMARGRPLVSLRMLDDQGKIISDQNTELMDKMERGKNLVIHRAALHEVLLEHLKPETLICGKKCSGIKQYEDEVSVRFSDGTEIVAHLIIAADGIHSTIRKQLIPTSVPRFAGYTCWRAVIENPGTSINHSVSAETWCKQGRFGISPLTNNKIYWYACIKTHQNNPQMQNMTPTGLASHFSGTQAPIQDLLNATRVDQLIWNDILDLKPLKRFVYGNVVLLGDAAHATTPNMGQGACQAIEDAVVLGQCLQQNGQLQNALKAYEKRRISRTKKIMQLSRFLGWVSHWQQPFWCNLRNSIFRIMPKAFTKRQIRWLFDVDFN